MDGVKKGSKSHLSAITSYEMAVCQAGEVGNHEEHVYRSEDARRNAS